MINPEFSQRPSPELPALRNAAIHAENKSSVYDHELAVEDFKSIADGILARSGATETISYSSGLQYEVEKGHRVMLVPPVEVVMDGRPYWLHLTQNVKPQGESVYLMEATTYAPDEIRIAYIANDLVRNWRNEIADKKELEQILEIIKYMDENAPANPNAQMDSGIIS